MVQSINTKVDLVEKATSYHGLTSYGKIMIGDRGFEFYDDRNVNDFIQIPWGEIEYVAASVMFKGKKIPRFALHTKQNGDFSFSARDSKKVLRAVNKYIPDDKMLRSLTFMDVMKRKINNLLHK